MAKTTKSGGDHSSEEKFNRHFAASPEQCIKMGQLNGWTFIKALPVNYSGPILKVECFFEDEQTS